MINDSSPLPEPIPQTASTHIVHELMRFYWVLRRRKSVLLTSLGIFCLLGILFFATATRKYRAQSSLLVLKTGSEAWSPTMTADRTMQDQIETYQRLCTSAVVLEGTLERLPALPPEIDRKKSPNLWIDSLRELVSTNTIRRTSIIEIACISRDPKACVNVLNALIASYLDFIDQNHRSVAAEIVSVLEKERVDLENTIEKKHRQLLQAKHQGGDIGIKEDSRYAHPLVQRVVRLNESLLEVQQRRIQLEASLAAMRPTVQRGGDLRQHLLDLQSLLGKESVLSALGLSGQDATMLAAAEQQLLADHADLRTLMEHYGPRHPRVIQLNQRIQGNRQYLATFHQRLNDRLAVVSHPALGKTLLGMVEEHLAQTRENERQMHKQYTQAEAEAIALNDRMATVTIVERDLELLRNLHTALVNRIENTDINQSQADVRVSVINEPTDPTSPVSPILTRVLLICISLGSGTGIVIVYVMDVLDDRFRSPEELQEQLGLPVLAMIRKLPERQASGADSLQVYVAPNTAQSEAFRTLRTTLAFSNKEVGRVAVTSPEPGDGKTTVLANLGVTYAQVGKRTLLVDGDLRRPGLTTLFGLRAQSGLSDILRSPENIAQQCLERIHPSGIPGLDILPCGPRPSDPTELLSQQRFSELLGWAETLYDQILIDSPPILAASDAAIIGRLLDGVIMIVQPQKNHRRRVLRAAANVSSLGVRLLGVVVNVVSNEEQSGYYGYGGDYGYGYGYGADNQYGYDSVYEEQPHDEPSPADAGSAGNLTQADHDNPEEQGGAIRPARRRAA
jgi:capsular exopolysaccharide synthesis family protein